MFLERNLFMAQDEFETWWASFPRRVGKLAAQKEYVKARKLATAEELLEGVARYRQHKPKYADWCHPRTWLSQGRWADSYETTPAAPTQSVDDFLEQMGHWTAGCKRLHGGTCENANAHYAKVEADQQKASA